MKFICRILFTIMLLYQLVILWVNDRLSETSIIRIPISRIWKYLRSSVLREDLPQGRSQDFANGGAQSLNMCMHTTAFLWWGCSGTLSPLGTSLYPHPHTNCKLKMKLERGFNFFFFFFAIFYWKHQCPITVVVRQKLWLFFIQHLP